MLLNYNPIIGSQKMVTSMETSRDVAGSKKSLSWDTETNFNNDLLLALKTLLH